MLTYKNMPSLQAGLFKYLFHKQLFSILLFQLCTSSLETILKLLHSELHFLKIIYYLLFKLYFWQLYWSRPQATTLRSPKALLHYMLEFYPQCNGSNTTSILNKTVYFVYERPLAGPRIQTLHCLPTCSAIIYLKKLKTTALAQKYALPADLESVSLRLIKGNVYFHICLQCNFWLNKRWVGEWTKSSSVPLSVKIFWQCVFEAAYSDRGTVSYQW